MSEVVSVKMFKEWIEHLGPDLKEHHWNAFSPANHRSLREIINASGYEACHSIETPKDCFPYGERNLYGRVSDGGIQYLVEGDLSTLVDGYSYVFIEGKGVLRRAGEFEKAYERIMKKPFGHLLCNTIGPTGIAAGAASFATDLPPQVGVTLLGVSGIVWGVSYATSINGRNKALDRIAEFQPVVNSYQALCLALGYTPPEEEEKAA